MTRVILEATSLVNPLAEAWRRAVEIAGYDVTGALIGATRGEPLVEGWTACEDIDTTDVDILVSWWGLASVAHSTLRARLPDARHVIVVDTYPNASRLATEVRELIAFRFRGQRPDAFVCYSDVMSKVLRRRGVINSSQSSHTLVQPFPAAMHRDAVENENSGASGIIFTGRSDYLFTRARSMRKDALGDFLRSLLATGIDITVQEPTSHRDRAHLRNLGFQFYAQISNDDVLNGDLGRLIAEHDGQLTHYRIANRTIKRRVASGLSSRFALGLTANSPVIVPGVASGPRRMVEKYGVGGAADSPSQVLQIIGNRDRYRRAWRAHHHSWTAEEQTVAIRHALET